MRPVSSVFKINRQFSLLLFVVILICNVGTASGQTLKFENLSFSEALAKAKKSNQLVFVQFYSNKLQCNSTTDEGLSGDEIRNIFEKFVCIKVIFNTEDYKKIVSDYRTSPNVLTSIFVDSDGNYLTSILNYYTSSHDIYIKLAATAMANRNNPPFKIYADFFSKENVDKEFLRQYITSLTKNNFNVADLVDKYIKTLTLKDLENPSEIEFLISTAPIVNSKIFRLIRHNYDLYQKVFASIPNEEQANITWRVINLSKEKAVQEKDRNYMGEVLSFFAETYSQYYKENRIRLANLQMDFYQAIKDSSQYFLLAKQYYSSNVKVRKMDAVIKAKMDQSFKGYKGRIIMNKVQYNQLNKMAMSLSELSRNKDYLSFALKLSEQTLRYNYPPYFDTYAQILYKLGDRKDAINWQQKAVDLSNSFDFHENYFKVVLEKMKDSSL